MRMTPRQIQGWLRFARIDGVEEQLQQLSTLYGVQHDPKGAAKRAKALEQYLCLLQ